MSRHTEVYHVITKLVHTRPEEDRSEAVEAARAWLNARSNGDVRTIARDALDAIDALLRALEGGTALDTLFDAREALAKYVQRGMGEDDGALRVNLPPSGGVTLLRHGQHFTIHDDELEEVRDAVNSRKREVRKRQRLHEKAKGSR